MGLLFERRATRAILFRFGHGRYLDAWSLLHVTSGFILGVCALALGIEIAQGISFILVLLFLYEVFEAMVGIAEDVENALADVACGVIGACVAYACANVITPLLPEVFATSAFVALLTLLIGWKAYLARRFARATRNAVIGEKKSRRDTVTFTGSALATIPIPILLSSDTKFALTWFVGGVLLTLCVLYVRSIIQELLVAFLFALFVTSYQAYVYEGSNALVGHINIYPLVLWTGGLVLLREMYEYMHGAYKFTLVSGIYLGVLFCVEYVGYYLLGIHLSGNHPSLLGLGIIHGTGFIHWFYVCAGPLYLLVTDYLRVR